MIDGKALQSENKVYYVFYKPKGCICSLSDELGRKTVIDYLPDVKERIYPVGRLDYDTSGLLLMTNDGEFANLMMHPSSHLEKVYEVSVKGLVNGLTVRQLEKVFILRESRLYLVVLRLLVKMKNMEQPC